MLKYTFQKGICFCILVHHVKNFFLPSYLIDSSLAPHRLLGSEWFVLRKEFFHCLLTCGVCSGVHRPEELLPVGKHTLLLPGMLSGILFVFTEPPLGFCLCLQSLLSPELDTGLFRWEDTNMSFITSSVLSSVTGTTTNSILGRVLYGIEPIYWILNFLKKFFSFFKKIFFNLQGLFLPRFLLYPLFHFMNTIISLLTLPPSPPLTLFLVGSVVLLFILAPLIFTVGFHKRLGCVFVNECPWVHRAEAGAGPAAFGRCVWPMLTGRFGLGEQCRAREQAGVLQWCLSWSELPLLAISFCPSVTVQRSELPKLLPSLSSISIHTGLEAGTPMAGSSWMRPSARPACLPQLPDRAWGRPTFTAALLLCMTCEPQRETRAQLSVHKAATWTCFSSSSPSPGENLIRRSSHFQHFYI